MMRDAIAITSRNIRAAVFVSDEAVQARNKGVTVEHVAPACEFTKAGALVRQLSCRLKRCRSSRLIVSVRVSSYPSFFSFVLACS